MLDWFRRLRRASRKLVLPTRDAADTRNQAQLNYAKLTFSTADLIAQLAVAQHAQAEQLGQLAKIAPTKQITDALDLQRAAIADSAAKLEQLLNRQQQSVKELLDEHQAVVDELVARCYAPGWHERLIGIQVAFGFLQETHLRLVKAQPAQIRSDIGRVFPGTASVDLIHELLKTEIERIDGLSHRLALFARSVVGDALLAVRDVLNVQAILTEPLSRDVADANRAAFKALEPLTTELIGLHSQRMDRLGLTA